MGNSIEAMGTYGEQFAALWRLCRVYPKPTNQRQVEQFGNVEFYKPFLKQEAELSLVDYLDILEDVDPYTGQPMWPNGDDRVSQLHDTIPRICNLWLGVAIQEQVCALRLGIDEVFSVDSLSTFTKHELKDMLCGEEMVEWTSDELQQVLIPTGGMSRNTKEFKWLCQVLESLDHPHRRNFLAFSTAKPMLPPDGLSELRLQVSKPPQRQYKAVHPTAMTCVPKLYLPEYDNKKDLKAKLIFALENSAGFDDRVGNVQSF